MLLRDFGKARQRQFLQEAGLNQPYSGRRERHRRENQWQLLKAWSHLMLRIGKLLIALGKRSDTKGVEPVQGSVLRG